MTTHTVLLKESWAHVEDRADELASHFCAGVFLRDPDIRELFPLQLNEVRARFVDTLVTAIQMMDDTERLATYLAGIGRTHRRHHLTAAHYPVLRDALVTTLRVYGGERWCAEYDNAWREAATLMTNAMARGAAEDEKRGLQPYWHAEVIAHERRGPEIAVLTCRPLDPFPFQAGQYAMVHCRHQPRTWRPYSIANAPRPDQTLDFHVRARGAGWVSGALVRRLRVGDMITLSRAEGSMILNRYSTRDIVCVAGGTGLAPIKALVEEISRYNRSRWVHVLVAARHPDDLYDLEALRRMAQRHPWLAVTPVCDEAADAVPGGDAVAGPIDTALEQLGPWPAHDFYVSGPPAMVRASVATLSRMGVPAGQVRHDEMEPTPVVSDLAAARSRSTRSATRLRGQSRPRSNAGTSRGPSATTTAGAVAGTPVATTAAPVKTVAAKNVAVRGAPTRARSAARHRTA